MLKMAQQAVIAARAVVELPASALAGFHTRPGLSSGPPRVVLQGFGDSLNLVSVRGIGFGVWGLKV